MKKKVLEKLYKQGRITEAGLRAAVQNGIITEQEAQQIIEGGHE